MSIASGSKPAAFGRGLRERLLIAIRGFAVLAAVVGNDAFYLR
jgi:hypothetical protein